ncbi:hypothetical protein [Marinoscillum furvescens]|nr:hypothetical protein [Marinoscillum furvescens]
MKHSQNDWKLTSTQKQGLEKALLWIQWSIMILMLVSGLFNL